MVREDNINRAFKKGEKVEYIKKFGKQVFKYTGVVKGFKERFYYVQNKFNQVHKVYGNKMVSLEPDKQKQIPIVTRLLPDDAKLAKIEHICENLDIMRKYMRSIAYSAFAAFLALLGIYLKM